MTTKILAEYNAKDLYDLFNLLYFETYTTTYGGAGFIGNEFHLLKTALDEYGSAQIACAMLNCFSINTKTINVPYFIAGLKNYLVSYNPYIYWAVRRQSTKDIKKLWREFLFLDAVWLPTAKQRTRYKEVLEQLRMWAYAETGQKIRKTNTKKGTEKS
tara:strand:- start:747 stop:1220 length:474 start_codon:yes stop_codon:yes gene_type:complete